MNLRRGEVVDWYVEGGESAVLVEDHVLVLSALATRILQIVDDAWVPVGDVVEDLVAEFGRPARGDAGTLALETIEALAQRGVLVVDPSPGPDVILPR